MKNILTRLEKSPSTWFLLATLFIFFLLRIPSLVEPYWYGDEGIYEVIGNALRHGATLYLNIWDNKPPLLYLTYALFSGNQFSAKLLSLIFGLASVGAFFYLAKIIFKQTRIQYLSTLIFALLFATPVTEGDIANAENFMLLPILLAACLIYKLSERNDFKLNINRQLKSNYALIWKYELLAGLLLGIALLYKVVAVFDFTALIIFLLFIVLGKNYKLSDLSAGNVFKAVLNLFLPFVLGFLAPAVVSLIYFTLQGAGADFLRSVFTNNVGYVGYDNALLIPQGFLIVKLLMLFFLIAWLYKKRYAYSKDMLFILIWFSFEVFDSFFSQRNYTHYFLMSISSLSLLMGLICIKYRHSWRVVFPFALLAIFTIVYFINDRFINLPGYYNNYISYMTNQESADQYQRYFDKNVPQAYAIADYLKANTRPLSRIFIWGNSAQIYALSDTLPAGKYTVAYHITGKAVQETQNAIIMRKPKYIVVLAGMPPLPFPIGTYQPVFSISGNTIYEKYL